MSTTKTMQLMIWRENATAYRATDDVTHDKTVCYPNAPVEFWKRYNAAMDEYSTVQQILGIYYNWKPTKPHAPRDVT